MPVYAESEKKSEIRRKLLYKKNKKKGTVGLVCDGRHRKQVFLIGNGKEIDS